MILELVRAQPAGGMIERVDRGTRADRPERADGGARDEAALVHAEIFSGHDIGADLRVLVEEQRAADGRFDDARAGVEPNNPVRKYRLAAGILDKIDRDAGELHDGLRRLAPASDACDSDQECRRPTRLL